MNTILSFVIVLGLLIFVHELGHFLFAKWFGVRVLKFSLGFGPKVIGKKVGDTEYVISAIPLGGFVKMYGENPDEQNVSEEDKAVSFAHKSVGQRFGIVFAGPAFNILFPIVTFFLFFMLYGAPKDEDSTQIGEVFPDTPAAVAGMEAKDVIVEIDGFETTSWENVLDRVGNSGGEPLQFVVIRDGEEKTLTITPKLESQKNRFGEELEKRYLIGVMKQENLSYVRQGPVEALSSACMVTYRFLKDTLKGFSMLVTGKVPASELGGPILIAQVAGQQMEAGWTYLLSFMGFLSVNLAVLNLLPIPVLDGGHLMFLSIEAVRRKPMEERAQIIAQQIGLALLGTLMIFVFYNDIARIFTS